jgi:hypothetical protein
MKIKRRSMSLDVGEGEHARESGEKRSSKVKLGVAIFSPKEAKALARSLVAAAKELESDPKYDGGFIALTLRGTLRPVEPSGYPPDVTTCSDDEPWFVCSYYK